MLYYLKQEVIGEHVNSILEDADSRSETVIHLVFYECIQGLRTYIYIMLSIFQGY